jgi:ABC-2 type transport system ATP-binding protein
MPAVEVSHVVKVYGERTVVNDLSFAVQPGELFGLIGPNGAGKTTTIRMMLDIIKPDRGEVSLFGRKASEETKSRVGYLPEERGLYKKLNVMDTIVYLASLKGMNERAAETRAEKLLEQTGLLPHKRKKIDELSKGMGQIIQFIVTIIHEPALIVLDEPFSGLDPINTDLLKRMFVDLRNQGKSVILSIHQMNQVEELCDRILMINNGMGVLYGNLTDIKSKFRSNAVVVGFEGDLKTVAGARVKTTRPGYAELVLDNGASAQQVLAQLVGSGLQVNRFEVLTPSLNEIFLKVAGKNHE